jgi:hypothetical protein
MAEKHFCSVLTFSSWFDVERSQSPISRQPSINLKKTIFTFTDDAAQLTSFSIASLSSLF